MLYLRRRAVLGAGGDVMMSHSDRLIARRLIDKYEWITCSPEFIEDEPVCTHILCILERAM